MSNSIFSYCLSFFLVIVCSNTVSAQLEGYAEFAYLKPAAEAATETQAIFEGKGSWSTGVDVIYGKSLFSPLVGLHFSRMNYQSPTLGDRKIKLDQIAMPLGVSYHIRPRTTSFNLMFLAAYAPYLELTDDSENILRNQTVSSSVKIGVSLTLDYLYFGARWLIYPEGRFRTANNWTTTNSYVVGVRF